MKKETARAVRQPQWEDEVRVFCKPQEGLHLTLRKEVAVIFL